MFFRHQKDVYIFWWLVTTFGWSGLNCFPSELPTSQRLARKIQTPTPFFFSSWEREFQRNVGRKFLREKITNTSSVSCVCGLPASSSRWTSEGLQAHAGPAAYRTPIAFHKYSHISKSLCWKLFPFLSFIKRCCCWLHLSLLVCDRLCRQKLVSTEDPVRCCSLFQSALEQCFSECSVRSTINYFTA